MLYICISIFILILIYRVEIKKLPEATFSYPLLFLILTLLSALSYRMGIDPIRYEDSFNRGIDRIDGIKDLLFSFAGDSNSEPIWRLINRFWYILTGEFQWVKATVVVFFNGVVFWFVKKHSPAKYTAIFLYFVLFYNVFNFEVYREAIAVAFFLIALDKICQEEPKIIKYYLWMIPCVLSHRFAFLALFYPLLTKVKLSRNFYIFFIAVILLAPFLFSLVNTVLNMGILNFALTGRVEYLMDDETYGSTSLNFFGYSLLLITKVIPLYIILIMSNADKNRALSFCYIIILVLSLSSFVILYRINNYLCIPLTVALSSGIGNSLFQKGNNSRIPKTIILLCLVVFISYSILQLITSETFGLYYPYSSILNKETDPIRESIIYELFI